MYPNLSYFYDLGLTDHVIILVLIKFLRLNIMKTKITSSLLIIIILCQGCGAFYKADPFTTVSVQQEKIKLYKVWVTQMNGSKIKGAFYAVDENGIKITSVNAINGSNAVFVHRAETGTGI